MTKEELLKLEKQCWQDISELEYCSPNLVLNLINEIKRLNGWDILKRRPAFSITPTEFDFSELDNS